jgi:hypothetical protein
MSDERGIPCRHRTKLKSFGAWLHVFLPAILFAVVFTSCGGGGGSETDWQALNRPDVVGERTDSREAIQVNVYLDATSSMTGYVAKGSSEYIDFLERFEATVETGWVRPELSFYKFGTQVRAIDRDEFRRAREVGFYREPGIFRRTNIDLVIERTDTSRVSVVVTDLFQNDQDVTRIVSQIRDRCLRRGVKVGILGIPSSFDGRVYDARVGPYEYTSSANPRSYRPFYALVFGPDDDLRLLTETLVQRGLVEGAQTLLITDFLADDVRGRVDRSPQARGVNKSVNGVGDFNFIMNDDVDRAEMIAQLAVRRSPSAPAYMAGNLQMSVLHSRVEQEEEAAAAMRRASPASNVSVQSITASADTATVSFQLQQSEPGTHLYRMSLDASMPGALQPPDWVSDFSSPNPSPSDAPNKTLNLEAFVQGVLDAHATINAPRLALFDIQILKRE